MKLSVSLLGLSLTVLFGSISATAQVCPGSPGCLDTTFGDGGKTIMAAPNAPLPINILTQADGKIVTMGRGTSTYGHTITRINVDGTPDATFGSGGMATFVWSGGNANDFALQTIDGVERILVTGTGSITSGRKSVSGRLRIDRLLPNGTLDPSWGNNGVLLLDANSAYGITVQPDQKILVTSSSYGTLMRLNANGTIDTSFGSGGSVNSGNGQEIRLDPSGRIYVAGIFSTGKGNNVTRYYFVRRFSSTGVLDNTFGSNGLATSRAITTSLFSMALDAFGNVLLGSHNGSDLIVERFDASGHVDSGFSEDGYISLDFARGTDNGSVGVTADSFGRVIVAGNVKPYPGAAETNAGVFRLNYDGSLDTSFANGGKLGADIAGVYDYTGSVILQGDPFCACQRIVLAGGTTGGATNQFTFAAFTTQ
jgi:uncharacterized delta-60 repeat protein